MAARCSPSRPGAPARTAAAVFAELDPRLFAYNSSKGWCESCFGTGQKFVEFDAEQDRRGRWLARYQHRSGALRRMPWRAAESTGVGGDLPRPVHCGTLRACGHRARNLPRQAETRCTRNRHRRRHREGDRRTARVPAARGSRLSCAGSRGTDAVRRETQRLRLAAQLGSNLRGVCYVLDEPTIGLHPRDNRLLLDALRSLAVDATRWWWSSTTKRPYVAPTMCSTSVPAPARAVVASWPRARWPKSCAYRNPSPAAACANRCDTLPSHDARW